MNLNPIVLSIPIFFILIGIELVAERWSHRHLYRFPDAIANLSCGITSQLTGLFLKVVAIGFFGILYENFALIDLVAYNDQWWYWLMLFLLTDFAYYWAHRMSHEINLFWGGHVVHHQSEEYNLSVALRQSSLQVVWTFAFSLPIALIGFNTLDFAFVSALNTLYQFWIHTETIGKFPKWIEFIWNTPSHHRVHHGRNPKYIDKNHAGSLIIWDRMFGTFQEEEERPTYGITKPLRSWNAVYANFSHYVDMVHDLKQIPGAGDKIKYLFMKPGWLPDSMGGYRKPPEITPSDRKFDTPAPLLLTYYVLFQFIVILAGTAFFLFTESNYALEIKGVIAVVISWSVVMCGVLFEHRRWAYVVEWLRIILLPAAGIFIAISFNAESWLIALAASFLFISTLWYYAVYKALVRTNH